jgi:diguanylate cyclase (GGDEF)-like protein
LTSPPEPASFSTSVRAHLASVERRDWELWTLALGTIAFTTVGLVLVLVPAFFSEDHVIRLSATVTPEMLLAVVATIGLLLVYLVHKQIQLRAARIQSINDTWNYEVSRLQLLLDPLTRVYNRSALHDLMGKEISRARRHKSTITFLYIDVDDFKQANTDHGHLFGDLVLAEVGGILRGATRGSDFVFRIGGDEFLVALVDTTEEGAVVVKQRIVERVNDWCKAAPLPGYRLRLSCGVQELGPDGSLDDALSRADARMYAEKARERA